jgi:hypothetical protein
MSKNDEYRGNAAECCRMASGTQNQADKRRWLDMAQHWFAKSEQQSVEEKFDAADKNS